MRVSVSRSNRLPAGSLVAPRPVRLTSPRAQKLPSGLQAQATRLARIQVEKRYFLHCKATSPEAAAENAAEEAISAIPHLEADERIVPWGEDKRGFRKRLQVAYKYLTKKAWIVALALYYFYNEAVATLPWVKIKRFEQWFWSTVRCRWLNAMDAATVLGRQWWKDMSKNMNWRMASKHVEEKREEMEGEVHDRMEHVKEDIEESVQQQKERVNGRVPPQVNPLLMGQNLREKLDATMQSSGIGEHVEGAVSSFKRAVPILRAKHEAEAEAKAEAEAELAGQEENASPAAGFLNLPISALVGQPSNSHDAEAPANGHSSSKQDAGEQAGEPKQETPKLVSSFLPLFGQKNEDGEGSEEALEQEHEVESNGRRWPLPVMFWKH